MISSRKIEGAAVRDELDELIDGACEADPLPLCDEDAEPPRGPPLSPGERRHAQLRLAMSQTPADFIANTNTLCGRCNSEDFFNRPYLKFLHDAYVLAKLVELTPVENVRLAGVADQWPDGYVTLAGKTHNIEITSTHGRRKLGKEYRSRWTARMDPVENWVASDLGARIRLRGLGRLSFRQCDDVRRLRRGRLIRLLQEARRDIPVPSIGSNNGHGFAIVAGQRAFDRMALPVFKRHTFADRKFKHGLMRLDLMEKAQSLDDPVVKIH